MKNGVKRVTKQVGLPGVEGVTKRIKGHGVEVGVLAGTGEHPNAKGGQTIAEIAFWNEFGAKKGQPDEIPARPFMRTAIKKNLKSYRSLMKKLLKAILKGKISSKNAEGILGLTVQKDIQQEIVTLRTPINAPRTIKKKKSDNPLIDTGALRQHISWASLKRAIRKYF